MDDPYAKKFQSEKGSAEQFIFEKGAVVLVCYGGPEVFCQIGTLD